MPPTPRRFGTTISIVPSGRAAMDTAVVHVGEVQVAVGVDPWPLDQSVAPRQHLDVAHRCILPEPEMSSFRRPT